MMNFLLQLYPGDHATLFFANVIVQVTIITSLAIFFTRFPVRPSAAARSSICLCALGCVLLVPLMAYSLDASGITFVRLPVLATAASISEATLSRDVISETTALEIAEPDVHQTAPQFANSVEDQSEVPRADAIRHPAVTPSQPLEPVPAYSNGDKWRMVVSGGLLVWLSGMLVCAVRLLRGCLVLRRLRTDVGALEDQRFAGVLEDVCRTLGLNRLPKVAVSRRLAGPVVTDGLGGPLVILPEGLLCDLDDRQLRDVLTHECAHLVQRDILVGLLQRTAQIIFWPHVLVHRVNGELTNAREDLCDNFVLRRGDATSYARTLVEISQALPETHVPIGACGMFNSDSQLEARIVYLLNEGRSLMTRTKRSTLVILGMVFLSVSALVSGSRVVPAVGQETGAFATSRKTPSQSQQAKETVGDTQADAKQPVPKVGKNYIVVPITTGLQRLQLKSNPTNTAYVLLNAPALVDAESNHLSARALATWDISRALRPYAAGGSKGVRFSFYNGPIPRSNKPGTHPLSFVSMSMKYVGDREGFQHVEFPLLMGSPDPNKKPDWKTLVSSLAKIPTEEDLEAEAGIGDDQVMLYPVRTPLGRHFNPDVDCVIHIIPPIQKAKISILQTMKDSLPLLGLKEKRRVKFVFHWTGEEDIRPYLDEYTGESVWKDLLGFESDISAVQQDYEEIRRRKAKYESEAKRTNRS